MNPTRPVLALLAAVAAAGALFAVPSPAIDLVADADVLTWWERHGTAAAVIGVVHVAALAATTYVVAVLTLVASAALVRCPAAALRLARFGPTPVRRWLVAGLVAGSLAAPAGAHAPARDVSTSPAAETRIVLVDLGPAPPTTEAPSTREGFRWSMAAPTPDAWRVEAGDSLWTIAAATLADRTGEAPDVAQIAGYWRALIDANTDRIVDPDLIHPGQVVHLPPMIRAGS